MPHTHKQNLSFFWVVSDILTMVRRNLIKYTRLPQLLVFSTIQPVMFVLLFSYVFGGAIKIPGVNYINFLLPGILVQSVMFGSIQTSVGLSEDITRGMIDRFRSLPMARSAVLAGRTISDMARNVFVVLLMMGVGYLIGFRFQGGFPSFILMIAVLSFFGFAFSWVAATIGLTVKNSEAAQVAGFVWVFPIVFMSSIFVPVETMPNALQVFAKHSPITVTVNTVRALSLNTPLGNNLWQTALWIGSILVVFVVLAVRQYRRM